MCVGGPWWSADIAKSISRSPHGRLISLGHEKRKKNISSLFIPNAWLNKLKLCPSFLPTWKSRKNRWQVYDKRPHRISLIFASTSRKKGVQVHFFMSDRPSWKWLLRNSFLHIFFTSAFSSSSSFRLDWKCNIFFSPHFWIHIQMVPKCRGIVVFENSRKTAIIFDPPTIPTNHSCIPRSSWLLYLVKILVGVELPFPNSDGWKTTASCAKIQDSWESRFLYFFFLSGSPGPKKIVGRKVLSS